MQSPVGAKWKGPENVEEKEGRVDKLWVSGRVGMAWRKRPVWKEAGPGQGPSQAPLRAQPRGPGQTGPSTRDRESHWAWNTASRRSLARGEQQKPTLLDSALFPKMRDAYTKPGSPSRCFG